MLGMAVNKKPLLRAFLTVILVGGLIYFKSRGHKTAPSSPVSQQ